MASEAHDAAERADELVSGIDGTAPATGVPGVVPPGDEHEASAPAESVTAPSA
jgi:hypothetical protein